MLPTTRHNSQEGESKTLEGRISKLTIVVLILILSFGVQWANWLPNPAAVQAQTTTKVAVDPQSVADLSLTPGNTVSFTVNVTDAPVINSYKVSLEYNTAVLDATSLIFSGNVLETGGNTPNVLTNCINGAGAGCTSGDGPGVVTLALFLLVARTPTPVSGLLFRVTFNVVGTGFSQLHLPLVVISLGLVQVSTVNFDGYFTNIDCPSGSGQPCRPPVPDFTHSPAIVVKGRLITFNGSSSQPSPGATIVSYFWSWGDGSLSNPATADPVTTHIFDNAASYPVSLQVTDSNGIKWSRTIFVTVINILIDLAAADLTTSQSRRVLPGAIINITAIIRNLGVGKQNGTLQISLEGTSLGGRGFLNLLPQQARSFSVTWNTEGYRPRVYRVDAVVPVLTNSTTGQPVENVTSNNIRSIFVQLIEPFTAASLGLLPSTGLGVLLVAGAVFAVARLRRKPVIEDVT